MAAAVRVEAMAFTDVRFDFAARQFGYSRDTVMGKMLRTWSRCTELQRYDVEEFVLVEIFEHQDARNILLKSELIREANGVLYVRGTKGKIEWLQNLRDNAKKGGRANAKQKEARRKPNAIQIEAKTKPSYSDSYSGSNSGSFSSSSSGYPGGEAHVMGEKAAGPPSASGPPSSVTRIDSLSSGGSFPVPQLTLVGTNPSPPRTNGAGVAEDRRHGEQRKVTDAFQAHYVELTGLKPTWGPKQLGMIKRLLTSHPADEIVRRIENLFTAPPPFLAHCAPDLGTLVQHFDKLVGAHKPKSRGLSDEDLYQKFLEEKDA